MLCESMNSFELHTADLTVYRAGSGEPVELLSLWQVKIMPMLEASGVQVIAVGLGSAANAQ
ncbi:hypothetical protein QJQ45_029796, partial [Haematococcus lacustris]